MVCFEEPGEVDLPGFFCALQVASRMLHGTHKIGTIDIDLTLKAWHLAAVGVRSDADDYR